MIAWFVGNYCSSMFTQSGFLLKIKESIEDSVVYLEVNANLQWFCDLTFLKELFIK